MTIYELLGIDHILMDVKISPDLIIENIDSPKLRRDAEIYFWSINQISLRASLSRGDHYVQILEVEVSHPEDINRISYLIQKAIKYRILFVFIFEGRYLLLRRSFELTMSTEHVYTETVSLCSDWIYEEYLNEDILYAHKAYKVVEQIDTDNEWRYKDFRTDYMNFGDLISNVQRLNNAIIESDCISLRWLLDWLKKHEAGSRIGTQIFERLREINNELIEDYIFFDKQSVRYALSDSDILGRYNLSNLDHTGRHPWRYFDGTIIASSHDDAFEFYRKMRLDEQISHLYMEKSTLPADVKKRYIDHSNGGFGGVSSASEAPRNRFISDIILRWYTVGSAHLISELKVQTVIIEKLTEHEINLAEKLCEQSYDSLDFLSTAQKVELLLCLDRLGLRTDGCSKELYPDILDYLAEQARCEVCGGPLDKLDLSSESCACSKCKARLRRVKKRKAVEIRLNKIRLERWFSYSIMHLSFKMDSEESKQSTYRITTIKIINQNGDKITISEDVEGSQVTTSQFFSRYFYEKCKVDTGLMFSDIDFIECQFESIGTKARFTFVYKLPKEIVEDEINREITIYDYRDHLMSAEDRKIQAEAQVRSIEQRLLEEERRKAEEQRLLEEERRKAEEQRRLEEERRKAEEQRRLEEERRRAEEQRRLEEERRRAEEQRRLEEERRKAEEQRRLEEERCKAEELRRLEEERRKAEEQRQLEEEHRKVEEQRRIEEGLIKVQVQRLANLFECAKTKQIESLIYTLRAVHRNKVDEEKRFIVEEKRRLDEERRRAKEQQWLETERKRQEALQLERECRRAEVIRQEQIRLREEERRKQVEQQEAEKRRLEEVRQESIYQNALQLLSTNEVDSINRAIATLQSIPGWKDANKLVRKAKNDVNVLIKQRVEKQRAAYREQRVCQHCGGKFKGIFKKVCTNCGRSKDY